MLPSKLKFRRSFHKSQRQVEGLSLQAEAGLERLFFKRLSNLGHVWRFIVGWVLLLVLILGGLITQLEGLSNHYQTVQPVAGGTYTEGILGSFTNANPLFATSEVDTAVSRLVFDGLFRYDQHNQLVGNLATSYDVDPHGTVYTVHLRPDVRWQDGQPLTADDVVFTYGVIQNPDAQSPLAASWQGIKVAKKDAQTVTFTLPTPLSSFAYNLTNGIVPQHLLASHPVGELRTIDFNTVNPVGSGPFKWSALQVERSGSDDSEVLIALKANTTYHGGAPKLDSFVVDAFSRQASLLQSFRSGRLNGAVGIGSVPADLAKTANVQRHDFILSAATMAFFNTTSPILSDVKVRQALVAGTDTPAIIRGLGYTTQPVKEPLLSGQLAYDPAYAQTGFNPIAARASLDADGWLVGKGGVRYKAGQPLAFRFYAIDTPENNKVAHKLVTYWKSIGAQVDLQLQSETTLRDTVSARNYDILLYSVSIGVDPDVFVYWDSSQSDPRSTRLNLSNYRSTVADTALEAGRTRLDPTLRVVKYRSFLQAWQQDAPALGLYQPRFLYLTHQKVYGLDQSVINVGTDRFDNVQNWEIRTAKVTN
jgi:peptide/nickel transport system substrate-binding protein